MTKHQTFRALAAERAADGSRRQADPRPLWMQSLIVAGAVLSALGVVYAGDVLPALVSAAVFLLFYRRLQPSTPVMAQQPAPSGPDEHEQRRSAA